jgi:enhancing lycopene biosynthesis protein 2
MNKKIAVILSGCGVYDGSEIHEATLTLYALAKNEVEYECFAPDINQHHVINHLTGKEMQEQRNVLIESARIARGKIKPLSEYKADNFDGIIFPGGFGAAKNLSTYAIDGPEMKVNADVERALIETHKLGKVIGALCISPTIVAKVLGAKVTIGTDINTALHITQMGGAHVNKEHFDIAIDEKNKIVTNPCYMNASNIYQVGIGAEAAVEAMIGLTKI